jgi:hypothetical protein
MSISASKRKRTTEHLMKLQEGRRKSKNSIQHREALKSARKEQENCHESGYYQSEKWKTIAAKTQETKRKKKEGLVNGD